jgi:AraC-like DNA-binding protein
LAVTLAGEYSLADAYDVADALSLLTDAPPDMLIVSPSLPGRCVPFLVRVLRTQIPGCPVLLITEADHLNAAAQDLLGLNINGYFLKPLRFEYLIERITALLGSRHRHRIELQRLSSHVSKAIQHLSCQPTPIVTVRELADLVGISVGHFSHAFALEAGMSPKAYLNRLRIELAKRLLYRTSRSQEIIAGQLGFYDASHLSRVFRHHTGQPPGRFRRRW